MSGQSFQCRPHTYHTLDFTMIVQYQKWPSTNQNWIEEKKNNSDLAVFLIIFFSKIRPDTWFESNWRGNHDIYSFIYDTLRGSSSSPFGGKKKGAKMAENFVLCSFQRFPGLMTHTCGDRQWWGHHQHTSIGEMREMTGLIISQCRRVRKAPCNGRANTF